jgi:hypothetical protein
MTTVPIAKLNRNTLQKSAESRIEEARILIENNQWTGSYYLTGFGVECALKACLARAVREYDYPDKKFVNDMYQHKLQKLVQLDAGLWVALQTDMNNDPNLEVNWNIVKDWDDEKRYDIVREQEARYDIVRKQEARVLYAAAADLRSGVMQWIQGKW